MAENGMIGSTGIMSVLGAAIQKNQMRFRESSPETFDFNRFLSLVLSEINLLDIPSDRAKDPRTTRSALIAVNNAIQIGLMPGKSLGYCYFVPYLLNRGKPGKEHYVINYIPGYRGYLELAFSNGFISRCTPEVVLNGERVERFHTETGPHIRHEIPTPRGQDIDRSTVIGAYCTYSSDRGVSAFTYMERSEIDKCDSREYIWKSHYHPMVLKSVIRRASKSWRLSQQMARAVQLDEQAEDLGFQDGDMPTDGDGVQPLDLSSMQLE